MKIIKRIKKTLSSNFFSKKSRKKEIIDFINKFDMKKVSEIHIYPEEMEIVKNE